MVLHEIIFPVIHNMGCTFFDTNITPGLWALRNLESRWKETEDSVLARYKNRVDWRKKKSCSKEEIH